MHNSKQMVAIWWRLLHNASQTDYVVMWELVISILHGMPGYKRQKNTWVAPKSSELSRYNLEDNQDAAVLPSLSSNRLLPLDDVLPPLMVLPL